MLMTDLTLIVAGALTALNIYATRYLYKRLGASLNLKTPDPYTYLFISQLVFAVLGSYFVLLSFDSTDWLTYLESDNPVRLLGWFIVQYSFFAMGISMVFAQCLSIKSRLRINFHKRLASYTPNIFHEYKIIIFFFFILTISGFYVFWTIGYIPLFKLSESTGTALAVIRSETKLGFGGMGFIRDNFFMGLSQILALYVFSLYLSCKSSCIYKFTFFALIIVALISTTTNLEKGGFAIFLISLVSMYAYRGNSFSIYKIIILGLVVLFFIILAYRLTIGEHVDATYLVSEITGRIFIAQVAGVFMTLSVFPEPIPFVGFDGIGIFAKLFDYAQNEGSPRLVMSYFWPKEVELGLNGFMSSYFPAEAYGNFGVTGVLLAPFIVGIVTVAYIFIFIRLRNPHLGAACIVYIIFNLPFTSNFSFFYYSPGLWILTVFIVSSDKILSYRRISEASNHPPAKPGAFRIAALSKGSAIQIQKPSDSTS
jgi:oligosaccharide repeat unit polymerase